MVIYIPFEVEAMNDSAVDLYAKLVVVILATMGFGYRAYAAWFNPDEHKEYLSLQRYLSRSWITKEDPRPPTAITVWFFKISYTLLFFLMIGILIWIIVSTVR